jgi:hypothetical protein
MIPGVEIVGTESWHADDVAEFLTPPAYERMP